MIDCARKKTTLLFLGFFMICYGCGVRTSSMTPQQVTNKERSRILSRWEGTYFGTVTYTYGHVTDKKGGEGIPARLVIRESDGQVLFDLSASYQNFTWQFIVPCSVFLQSKAEFSRNVSEKGGIAQYAVSAALSEAGITGIMHKLAFQPDGQLTHQGGYLFTVTKQTK